MTDVERSLGGSDTGKRRVKVLLVSPLPPPEGGIGTWTQRILAAAAMTGVDLHHLDTSVRMDHNRIGSISPRKILHAIVLMAKLLWTYLRVRPSVVHICSSGVKGYYRDMLYILLAKVLGKRVILNLRFGEIEAAVWERSPFKWLIRTTLRSCWRVVPIALSAADVVRRLGCERVEVIPNCVDIREYLIRQHDSQEPDGLKVLYVGWILPAKGIGDLLQAISRLSGTTLSIVGPVVQRSAEEWLHRLMADLQLDSRVKLLGLLHSEATRQVYRGHDVCVLASYREGFSNVILEAMEAGIPVVVTRVGANPEIIRDGVDGFLIDVGDVDALADRLRWLKEHPQERRRMGQAARERVAELYSVERVAGLWVDLYRRAAADRWESENVQP